MEGLKQRPYKSMCGAQALQALSTAHKEYQGINIIATQARRRPQFAPLSTAFTPPHNSRTPRQQPSRMQPTVLSTTETNHMLCTLHAALQPRARRNACTARGADLQAACLLFVAEPHPTAACTCACHTGHPQLDRTVSQGKKLHTTDRTTATPCMLPQARALHTHACAHAAKKHRDQGTAHQPVKIKLEALHGALR